MNKYVEVFGNMLCPLTASQSLSIDRQTLGLYESSSFYFRYYIYLYRTRLGWLAWHTCAPKTRKFILHTLPHHICSHMRVRFIKTFFYQVSILIKVLDIVSSLPTFISVCSHIKQLYVSQTLCEIYSLLFWMWNQVIN